MASVVLLAKMAYRRNTEQIRVLLLASTATLPRTKMEVVMPKVQLTMQTARTSHLRQAWKPQMPPSSMKGADSVKRRAMMMPPHPFPMRQSLTQRMGKKTPLWIITSRFPSVQSRPTNRFKTAARKWSMKRFCRLLWALTPHSPQQFLLRLSMLKATKPWAKRRSLRPWVFMLARRVLKRHDKLVQTNNVRLYLRLTKISIVVFIAIKPLSQCTAKVTWTKWCPSRFRWTHPKLK